jgi:hypothetical protein
MGPRLPEEDIRQILSLRFKSKLTYSDIVRRMRAVSYTSVTRVCQGTHPDSARLKAELGLT